MGPYLKSAYIQHSPASCDIYSQEHHKHFKCWYPRNRTGRVIGQGTHLVVRLENTDSCIAEVISKSSDMDWGVGLPLIQPKLQNKQQNAPDTASHASIPPSGKELGSKPGGPLGFSPGCAFSRSTSSGSSAVSGNIFASVCSFGSE